MIVTVIASSPINIILYQEYYNTLDYYANHYFIQPIICNYYQSLVISHTIFSTTNNSYFFGFGGNAGTQTYFGSIWLWKTSTCDGFSFPVTFFGGTRGGGTSTVADCPAP